MAIAKSQGGKLTLVTVEQIFLIPVSYVQTSKISQPTYTFIVIGVYARCTFFLLSSEEFSGIEVPADPATKATITHLND
jgi:hypothetical protein